MCTTNTPPIRLPGLTLVIPPADLAAAPPVEEGDAYADIQIGTEQEEDDAYASIEIAGLTPAPSASTVAHREWSPLDTLSRALRSGGALTWAGDCFVLRDPGGVELARGARLHELALCLNVIQGKVKRKPGLPVSLSKGTLLNVGRVLCIGESLSGFIRGAVVKEIAARLAQDEEELQNEGEVLYEAAA